MKIKIIDIVLDVEDKDFKGMINRHVLSDIDIGNGILNKKIERNCIKIKKIDDTNIVMFLNNIYID